MKKETVCVQIGTAANYVGAHFWNLQDEYLAIPPPQRELSPATFFREEPPGTLAARSGLLYSPRLQLIDASGAFGALSAHAGSVLPPAEVRSIRETQPSGRVERYVREPITPSDYVQSLLAAEDVGSQSGQVEEDTSSFLQNDVKYWSDYLKAKLHPRTCFPLAGVHHNVTNWSVFETGEQFARPALVDDLYADLRVFIEECDTFGGVCVTTNADDAYAGLAANYLTHLNDELGSSPVLVFAVHNLQRGYPTLHSRATAGAKFDLTCARNEAMLVSTCLDLSAEYVPMSTQPAGHISLLNVSRQSLFQATAVLALAQYVSLGSLQHTFSLANLFSMLRPAPFASLSSLVCNFPSATATFEYGRNLLATNGSTNLSDVWRHRASKQDSSITLPLQSAPSLSPEVVTSRGLTASLPIVSQITTAVTVPVPFPPIFDPSLERNRFLALGSPEKIPGTSSTVEQIAALAGLCTDSASGYRALKALGEATRSHTVRRARVPLDMEEPDLSEVTDKLISRADDYLTQ